MNSRFFQFIRVISLLAVFWLACGVNAEESPLSKISKDDWPNWRGPQQTGIVNPEQDPPTTWSESDNILWATDIPGRGHGSIIVLDGAIYLATAENEPQVQSVLCLDQRTGQIKWKTVIHENGLPEKSNKKSSDASTTLATDGERIFVNFMSHGAVYTTALTFDGKILWQQKITDYIVHQGYGSSPVIYQDLVIVSADNKGGGALAGLDRKTGEIRWRRERPKMPNYPSPVIFHVDGRDQLFLTGCERVSSFDPATGKTLWEVEGATTECVTSTVTDGERIFSSGGYPQNHVAAIRADGSGKIEWENITRVYVPSMLIRDGHLYAVADAGVAICWDSATGKQRWKQRLGGTFSASPVMIQDRIYASNEEGKTFVYRATPEKMELIAENSLGDEVFATPTICGGRIYLRVAHRLDGKRQERIYCIGK